MKLKNFLLILLSIGPWLVYGQYSADAENKNSDRKVYLRIGVGTGPSSFQDQATSPLYYRGVPFSASLGRISMDNRKETNLGIQFSGGIYDANVNERSVGSSIFGSFTIDYARLYQLQKWSDKTWDFKTGGKIMATANLRGNERLQNNSIGFESFFNLMGSFKVSRDISRKEEKHKKFLFIEYTLRPRQRRLSYQLDVGLWNNYLRNRYSYIGQFALLNDDFALEDMYNFHTFSGLRFGSELSYTMHLVRAGNNAIQISYLWDAVRTAPGSDSFAMAFHVIRFSLLYNTK